MWEMFEERFKKISAKISDINLIKTYVSEFELPQNLENNLDEVNQIMAAFYKCHLRENSTKSFLKWCNKQFNTKLPEERERLATIIYDIQKKLYDEEMTKL